MIAEVLLVLLTAALVGIRAVHLRRRLEPSVWDGCELDQAEEDYWAEFDAELDDRLSCTWCDGEQWVECPDPIQCCGPHSYGFCPCSACQGSGLRSEQRVF